MLSTQNEVQQSFYSDQRHYSTLFASFHSIMLSSEYPVNNKHYSLHAPNILFKFTIPRQFLIESETGNQNRDYYDLVKTFIMCVCVYGKKEPSRDARGSSKSWQHPSALRHEHHAHKHAFCRQPCFYAPTLQLPKTSNSGIQFFCQARLANLPTMWPEKPKVTPYPIEVILITALI